jgi:N-methylhydantoinase A
MIAASNMIRAIKAVSSERGRDPRDFALVAFGGNGPVFAASIARAMQIRQVVIPPAAGVFSSIGLLFARVERHFVRTCLGVLRRMDPAQMASQLADFEQSVLDTMTSMGVARNECEVQRLASLRYPGQAYELTVPLPQGSVDANWLGALEEAFAAEHERTYGHRAGADEPAELVTLNFVGRDAGTKMAMPSQLASGPREESAAGTRRAYFGPETGWLTVPVLRRADLAGGRDGPFIVEEYDATCLVPRYASASLGADGSIVMNVDSEAQTAPHDAVAESRT